MEIRYYHNNKKEILKDIEFLNKMDFPLNMKRINHLFVGFESGEPVSFLGLNQRSGWYYFRGCYVLPESRGKGWQIKLMQTAIQKAKELGVDRISSLVSIDNAVSLRNAKKVGFEITGRQKDCYHIVAFLN